MMIWQSVSRVISIVVRILAIVHGKDSVDRVNGLIPYFRNGNYPLHVVARDALRQSAPDVAGPMLIPIFNNPQYQGLRAEIPDNLGRNPLRSVHRHAWLIC